MSNGINVSPEVLRVVGTGLNAVGEELDQYLNSLEAELQSFGEPWGNDDIGQLIGAAVQEVIAYAFECLRDVVNEIKESGYDLGGMADRYENLEQEIGDKFNSLFEQIGSY